MATPVAAVDQPNLTLFLCRRPSFGRHFEFHLVGDKGFFALASEADFDLSQGAEAANVGDLADAVAIVLHDLAY